MDDIEWAKEARRKEAIRDVIATILLLAGFFLLYWVLHLELG